MSNPLNANYWDWPYASVVRADGPQRVVVDQPAPDGWQPPPSLAFKAPKTNNLVFAPDVVDALLARAMNPEPLLWEGDQA